MSRQDPHDILVIGDSARTHGRLRDYAVVNTAIATRFDNGTDTWTVTTVDGKTLQARVLVDTTPGADGIVAAHGTPNYFRIPGPHTGRQASYVAGLIETMRRGGSTRIEARSAVRVRRHLPNRTLSRFYLTGSVGVDDEIYEGAAVLTHGEQDYRARVRLTGHFDPIDGQYHWRGTLYTDLATKKATGSKISIRIGEHTAAGKISEQTPWGTLAVAGSAGYPPFPLPDVEINMPPRM